MAESRFDARRWPRQSAGRSRIPASSAGARPRTTPARRRMRPLRRLAYNVGFAALGLLAMLGGMSLSPTGSDLLPSAVDDIRTVSVVPTVSVAQAAASQHFALCGSARRVNCVVDGDTFYFRGEKIRVADINTPEVSEPKCAHEARLGAEATRRFQSLLNAGPIELRRGARDEDRYGRKLRTVHRNGRSLGETLVAEGLAHPWRGRKEDWCA